MERSGDGVNDKVDQLGIKNAIDLQNCNSPDEATLPKTMRFPSYATPISFPEVLVSMS